MDGATLSRRVVNGLAGLILSGPVFPFANKEEFWDLRVPSEWTQEEVQILRTASPWARKVRAQVPPEPNRPKVITRETLSPANAIGTSQVAHVGTAMTSMPRNPTAGGVAFYGETTMRWESAAPILAAAGTPLAPEFANHYVLSVSGLPTQLLNAVVPLGMAAFRGTNLKFKGQDSIPVRYVVLMKDKRTLGFAMPIQPVFKPQNEPATFTMICQGLMLATTFELKSMRYRGELAL